MLESLFSRVRSALGSNDNPTEDQLMSIICQLIVFNELSGSEYANCEDILNILTVTSSNVKQNQH